MRRIAVLAVLLAAGVAHADGDDDNDDIDDHPLAIDLRSAFGHEISQCRGDKCALELTSVTCTTMAARTTCRALAPVHSLSVPYGLGPHKATGPAAKRLAAHLREVFNDREINPPASPTVTIARIGCTSFPNGSHDGARGHCSVERQRGDAALHDALAHLSTSEGMPLLEQCKLTAFCWTGVVRASCDGATCTLSCPAGSEDAEWTDKCHVPSDPTIRITDAGFAASVRARTGRSTATIGCYTSGGTIDGGVTSMVACDVKR
jgi:hypothetical protein